MNKPALAKKPISVLVVLAACMAPAAPGVVVGWRNDGTGKFPDAAPPASWDPAAGKNIRWRTSTPDWSNASPIAVGNRLFINAEPDRLICVAADTGNILWSLEISLLDLMAPQTAAPLKKLKAERDERRRQELAAEARIAKLRAAKDEAAKAEAARLRKELYAGRKRIKELEEQLAAATGEKGLKWSKAIGYTMSTPVSDGAHVWVKYGSGAVACVDLEGGITWLRRFDYDGTESGAPSPLLVGGRLVFEHVPEDENRVYRNEKTERTKIVTALNAETGDPLWESPPLRNAGWGAGGPLHVRLGDTDLVITGGGNVLRAADGRLLAEAVGMGGVSTAVAHDGLVFFCDDKVMEAVRLAAGPDRDRVTHESVWKTVLVEKQGNSYGVWSSPVCHDGFLYAIDGEGTLFVIEAATGKVTKRLQPLEHAAARSEAYPSLTLAGNRVYCGAHRQAAFGVVSPGPDAKVLARIPGFGEALYSTPFFAGDRMYLRTQDALYCIANR